MFVCDLGRFLRLQIEAHVAEESVPPGWHQDYQPFGGVSEVGAHSSLETALRTEHFDVEGTVGVFL